jgi:hypothetical protein
VNLPIADEHFAIGPKSSPFQKEALWSDKIAAFGRALESARGQETRIKFEAKVATEIVIDKRSSALEPLVALVGK